MCHCLSGHGSRAKTSRRCCGTNVGHCCPYLYRFLYFGVRPPAWPTRARVVKKDEGDECIRSAKYLASILTTLPANRCAISDESNTTSSLAILEPGVSLLAAQTWTRLAGTSYCLVVCWLDSFKIKHQTSNIKHQTSNSKHQIHHTPHTTHHTPHHTSNIKQTMFLAFKRGSNMTPVFGQLGQTVTATTNSSIRTTYHPPPAYPPTPVCLR